MTDNTIGWKKQENGAWVFEATSYRLAKTAHDIQEMNDVPCEISARPTADGLFQAWTQNGVTPWGVAEPEAH